MQIRDAQVWSFEEEGTFALAERRHLSMRARALSYRADPTAFEDEAEVIPSLSLSAPWRQSRLRQRTK